MLSTIPRLDQEPGLDEAQAKADEAAELLDSIDLDQTSIRDALGWLLDDAVKLARLEGSDPQVAIADSLAWLNIAAARIVSHQIDSLRK